MGRAAGQALARHGVTTIGQLAAFDREALTALLGKAGGQLWNYANGLEDSPVAPAGQYTPPKSVGNGLTFPHNLTTPEEVRRGLAMLCDEVAARLRRHRLKASTVQVTIRDPNFKDICRQRPLEAPAYTARELTRMAVAIVEQCWNRGPIRALTVTAHNLIPEEEAAEQLGPFDAQAPRRRDRVERLEKTMDAIRSKYGGKALTSASLAPAPKEEDSGYDDHVPF